MPILKSYAGFNPKDKKHQARFMAKLGEFITAPLETERAVIQRRGQILAKIGEFTAHTNTSAWNNVQNVIDVYADDIGDMDMGWVLAFAEVDLTGTPRSSFDIIGFSSGMTFERVPDGHRARIYGVSGSRINIPIDTYGAGIGFLQNWFDDQEWWNIEDAATKFRFEESEQKATLHYGLITAITDDVAYDTTGANTAEKDINTINDGVAEIVVENEDTGLGVNAQSQFLLYTHVNNYARLLKAMRTVVPDTSSPMLAYNVRLVPTTGAEAAYLGHLVAPGRKSKFGNRLNMEILADFDITMRGQDFVGWYRYGSYVNAAQVRRLLKA